MHRVEKRNKRLWIVNDHGVVYSPPDFIRPHMKDRKALQRVADELNDGMSYIGAIMRFERSVR